jgi:hypothetical protein
MNVFIWLLNLIMTLFKPVTSPSWKVAKLCYIKPNWPTVNWPVPRKLYAVVKSLNTVRRNRLGNSRISVAGYVSEYIWYGVIRAYIEGNATVAINQKYLPNELDLGLVFRT